MMHVNLCPNAFAESQDSHDVEITVTGDASCPDMRSFKNDKVAVYVKDGGSGQSDWTISNWKHSNRNKATFTITLQSGLKKHRFGASSGTLTVTGMDGTNPQSIPVPCSTT